MATASTIRLDVTQSPTFAVRNRTPEAAAKASQLLQENHEKHHIFWNEGGLHSHIAHHLPTIFALGAEPETLQKQWDLNIHHQLAQKPLEERVVKELYEPDRFARYLGQGWRYQDYLYFFQKEIEGAGWENVVNEYLFAGDDRAEDMLSRLFDGVLHPIIHLGFGVEFAQPALIAEALAETAIHSATIGNTFLHLAEQISRQQPNSMSPSLMELLQEVRKSDKLTRCIRSQDASKLRDGVIGRAGKEMAQVASRFTVRPQTEDLDEKLRQIFELCAYYTFASQRPNKAIKVDFFYLHAINAALFFERFVSAAWLSAENKARLLEWKGRYALAMYVSRGCPKLRIEEVRDYLPVMVQQLGKDIGREVQWAAVFKRANEMPDDGHVSKLVRACKVGEQLWVAKDQRETKPDGAGSVITTEMWLTMAHMAVDSTEGQRLKWVRTTGLDSAWATVGGREEQRRKVAAL